MKHESGYQDEPPTAVRLTRGRRGRPGPQGKRSRCSPGVGDLGAVGGTGEIFAHVKKGGGSPGGKGFGGGRGAREEMLYLQWNIQISWVSASEGERKARCGRRKGRHLTHDCDIYFLISDFLLLLFSFFLPIFETLFSSRFALPCSRIFFRNVCRFAKKKSPNKLRLQLQIAVRNHCNSSLFDFIAEGGSIPETDPACVRSFLPLLPRCGCCSCQRLARGKWMAPRPCMCLGHRMERPYGKRSH